MFFMGYGMTFHNETLFRKIVFCEMFFNETLSDETIRNQGYLVISGMGYFLVGGGGGAHL